MISADDQRRKMAAPDGYVRFDLLPTQLKLSDPKRTPCCKGIPSFRLQGRNPRRRVLLAAICRVGNIETPRGRGANSSKRRLDRILAIRKGKWP